MKLYYRQCKLFQFVDSRLFGQVRLAVFFGLCRNIFPAKMALPPRKNWPVRLSNNQSGNFIVALVTEVATKTTKVL